MENSQRRSHMSTLKITSKEVNPLQYVTLSKDINTGLYTFTFKIKLSGDRIIQSKYKQFCKVASSSLSNNEIVDKFNTTSTQYAWDNSWQVFFHPPTTDLKSSGNVGVMRILGNRSNTFKHDNIGKIPTLVRYLNDNNVIRVNSVSLCPRRLFNLYGRVYSFNNVVNVEGMHDTELDDTEVLRDGKDIYLQTKWNDDKSVTSTYKLSVNFNNKLDHEKTGKEITKLVQDYFTVLGFDADVKLEAINITTVDKFYIDNITHFEKFKDYCEKHKFELARNIQKKKSDKKYIYNIFITSRDIESSVSEYTRSRLEKIFDVISYNSHDTRGVGTAQIMAMMTDSLTVVKKAMFFLPIDKKNHISYFMDVNVFKDDFDNIKEVLRAEYN